MVAPASPARSSKEQENNEKGGTKSSKKKSSGKKHRSKKKAQLASLLTTRPDVALGEAGTTPFEAVEHKQRHEPQHQHHRQEGEEEVKEMVEEEKPALRKVLEDCRDRAADVREKIEALALRAAKEAEEDPGPRDEGASFLAAKQMMLTSYCRDLCAYVAKKGRGETLQGDGVAERLLELRTVMDKLRPTDRKLKYQTDKLLKLASTPQAKVEGESGDAVGEGGNDDNDDNDDDDDPLSFRPRPDAMAPWGQEAGETEEEGGRGKRSTKDVAHGKSNIISSGDGGEREGQSELYRAPRMSSVPYDEDGVAGGAAAAREEKRLAKRRQRVSRGEVMETLREEFGDQPEAVRAVGNAGRSGVSEAKMKRMLDEDRARLDFEEDHMVRLTVSRKAKKERARMEKDAGRLETIADVGNAADFVRVARDADGFGGQMKGEEDDMFGRGGGSKSKKRGKAGGSGGALGLAMGAVGRSMEGGSAGKKGKKKRRS